MKLEKAIEINEYLVELSLLHQCPDHANAIKLGNEALKRIKAIRPYSNSDKSYYLPGETK